VTHKKSHGVKHRSATQKKDTTTKFYCIEHGQNSKHARDKCYTLKDCTIHHMTVSRMDEVDSPSSKKTDKMEDYKTYQSRIKNLGVITNED
jgi:hypothetical protein